MRYVEQGPPFLQFPMTCSSFPSDTSLNFHIPSNSLFHSNLGFFYHMPSNSSSLYPCVIQFRTHVPIFGYLFQQDPRTTRSEKRGMNKFSLTALNPAHTSTQTPGLQNCETIQFCRFKPAVHGYCVTEALANEHKPLPPPPGSAPAPRAPLLAGLPPPSSSNSPAGPSTPLTTILASLQWS